MWERVFDDEGVILHILVCDKCGARAEFEPNTLPSKTGEELLEALEWEVVDSISSQGHYCPECGRHTERVYHSEGGFN